MIVPDVNLLLYATINGFPDHSRARDWWEDALNSELVGLTSPAIFGFVRISCNARLFESPLTVEKATGYIREWLELPNVRILSPGPSHVDTALGLLQKAGSSGNLTTHAQLAAFAIEQDAELHSNDTDFGRFPGLKWINPLQ